MQLPVLSYSSRNWRRFGRYTRRRCQISGDTDLADVITKALELLKSRARAEEDLEDTASDALADRDGLDRSMDLSARKSRQDVASRDLNAMEQAPYTQIFGEGIKYYTMATLSEQVNRYTELAERMTRYLAEDDPVRVVYVPQIQSDLAKYQVARDAERTAEVAWMIGKSEVREAKKELSRILEKVYGLLIDRYGKTDAESFFRRTAAPKLQEETNEEEVL